MAINDYDKIEIRMGGHGKNTKVIINGEDVSKNFYSVKVSADVDEVCRIELKGYAFKGDGGIVIKGLLLPETTEPAERVDAELPNDRMLVETTGFTDMHKQFTVREPD